MSKPWEHVTLTLRPEQVRLVLEILKEEHVWAVADGGDPEHTKLVDEVITDIGEQTPE